MLVRFQRPDLTPSPPLLPPVPYRSRLRTPGYSVLSPSFLSPVTSFRNPRSRPPGEDPSLRRSGWYSFVCGPLGFDSKGSCVRYRVLPRDSVLSGTIRGTRRRRDHQRVERRRRTPTRPEIRRRGPSSLLDLGPWELGGPGVLGGGWCL